MLRKCAGLITCRRAVAKARLTRQYEKIQVHVENFGYQDSFNMMLNRNISTPCDAAAHISKKLLDNAAIAVILGPNKPRIYDPMYKNVDEELDDAPATFVDMRQPLEDNCQLQILTHKIASDAPNEYFDEVNKAYWRTCSFFLAYTIKRAFAESVTVSNVKMVDTSVNSGSFAVEFDLASQSPSGKLSEWQASELDLSNFTKTARNFLLYPPAFQLLGRNTYALDSDVAQFDGPLVKSLDLIGPFAITNCARIENNTFVANGVSVPKEFEMNHALFGLLEQRARNQNLSTISPILSNVSKRKTFTYKQWTDEYEFATNAKVDLSNKSVEMAEIESSKLAQMEPDVNHPFNKEAREYTIGRRQMAEPIRLNVKQRSTLRQIWRGGKFHKSVYIDHERQ